MRHLALLLALLLSAALPLSAQDARPLDVDDVADLLGTSTPAGTLADFIRSSCVSFPLDSKATTRLRAAGADDALLGVIRTACFTGAELVVESQPPGAEVRVDGQRVGSTPWTARYAVAKDLKLIVQHQGATQEATARLQMGQRARAAFGFRDDTLGLPRVRTMAEVAQQLRLADRWRPQTPEPPKPNFPNGSFLPFTVELVVVAGSAVGGYNFCKTRPEKCWGEGGEIIGSTAGVVGGMLFTGLVNSVAGKVRRGSYSRAVAQREEWQRQNDAAREKWIQTHPDLVRAVKDDESKRAQAQAKNREIKERNQRRGPSRVTSEPLPGPSRD